MTLWSRGGGVALTRTTWWAFIEKPLSGESDLRLTSRNHALICARTDPGLTQSTTLASCGARQTHSTRPGARLPPMIACRRNSVPPQIACTSGPLQCLRRFHLAHRLSQLQRPTRIHQPFLHSPAPPVMTTGALLLPNFLHFGPTQPAGSGLLRAISLFPPLLTLTLLLSESWAESPKP